MNLPDLRENYNKGNLVKKDLASDPNTLFSQWMKDALEANVLEPNAMIVSTVTRLGTPEARVLLLKEVLDGDFVFYTNYNSDKAKELEDNPNTALTFLWKSMERQVRIVGKAAKVSRDTTEAYFVSRPRGSQIGAWVSPQSEVIESRDVLESELARQVGRYEGIDNIPAPPHWGGYAVTPSSIEFWQGRPDRLHDRIKYTKAGGTWKIVRLAP